ncbi:MAG: phosphogluconate dehydrogenase (NADP(+)-dependent, decarboxylating) [Alphaproteobacteria bacterium HGW-Alphaproteobacteria-6]|nr:MAG: phosphogluconate dehydrogenase (NADP(+)-dependent, decarboxylating) [Alphaproteobacteria bacterium HGW-Alphaproteobacteria-6]
MTDTGARGAAIGLVGLGTMGAALALNIAEKGFAIAVHNRTTAATDRFLADAGPLGARITGCATPAALVAALARPRAILIMVEAGAPVDAVIDTLAPLLDPGDLVIDAGNADFHDTRRREAALRARGLDFFGMGVSGGEEGARHGPSIMVGGPAASFARVRAILEAIAARYRGAPCAAHLGPDGAGHFVKTVHNGIEYGDMQMIAEIWGMLRDGRAMAPAAAADLFAAWDRGPLKSYLIEITARVLAATDPETGQPMIGLIADRAGQKGTGRWTLIEALRLGQSATTIEAAVAARSFSSAATARALGARLFTPPPPAALPPEADLAAALLAAKIIAYGQGLALLKAASDDYGWSLDLARIAEIWRAGCIIRSALLDDIARAVRTGLPEGLLIFAPAFAEALARGVPALRRTVAAAALGGHAAPALGAALSYFDQMTRARGTADLIQGQRDFFGAHGFERTDRPGKGFHGPWASPRG